MSSSLTKREAEWAPQVPQKVFAFGAPESPISEVSRGFKLV